MWPTGDTSPGPCQAVLTPNASARIAILRAGLNPPALRNMHANIVDEPLGNQRLPLMRTVEQLAHRDWSGTVLPYLPEVSEILGRERIFQEEHAIWLGRFAELHCLIGRQAFMHIVQQ